MSGGRIAALRRGMYGPLRSREMSVPRAVIIIPSPKPVSDHPELVMKAFTLVAKASWATI